MATSNQRADVQGLRAVAVLAVVVFHAGLPLPGGFSGVDVFFVISGFVIVAMLLRQWQSTGRIRLRDFYARRFRRLMPALAFLVSIVVLVGMAALSPFGPQQTLAWTALGSMLLSANVAIAATTGGYFDQVAITNPLLNTWSLSVEEQFYLIFPVFLVGALWASRKRSSKPGRSFTPASVTWLIAGLTTASFGLAVAANDLGLIEGSEILTGFYSPFTRAWEFGLGALLALVVAQGREVPAAIKPIAGILGAVLIALGFAFLDENLVYPGLWTLLPTVGAVLVIAAGPSERGPITWLLGRRSLVKFGDWSYSIYLWHWPVIVFAVLLFPGISWIPVVAAVVSFGPAIASYHFIENPLRRRSWGSRRRVAVTAGVIMGVPLILTGVLFLGSNSRWGHEGAQTMLAQPAANHLGFVDCMTFTSMGGSPALRPETCFYQWDAPGSPIYLVGDSNAAQLSEAVVGAAQLLDRPVRITTAAGCPFMDVYRYSPRYSESANAACRKYYDQTLSELGQSSPGVVVIGSSIGYWVDPGVALDLKTMPATGSVGPTPTAATEGLARAVDSLRRTGHQVIVVNPALTFPSRSVSYDQCPTLALFLETCPFATNVTEVDQQQIQAREDVRAMAAQAGAELIDLIDRQCPEGVCSAVSLGLPVYSDATHFSPEFSVTLAGRFAETMINSSRRSN